MSARRLRAVAVSVTLGLLGVLLGAGPARAESYVPLVGSGSTWSQVAIDAWTKDVRANGIVVNYTGDGSTQGRQDYIQAQSDFISTEIPFENPPEPGQQAEIPNRPFAYLPIVAGGTSLVYHLTVAGKLVRDLKLSGPTLAKIYTGAITNWDDPAITADYGKALPDEPIVPVIRSDGSGTSAQLTRYFAKRAPDIWCPFAAKNIGQTTCDLTSFYPTFGNSKGQVGSNGVANYVAASYGEGSIGYVEYAYAREVDYPVVSVLNKAGYFNQPSPSNVAVALTAAKLNADLTQNLDGVYNNPDPRTYPISSYSYMVVPTTTASPFTTAKGRTLSTFINYFLCGGQQKAGILGYSPLPENLVKEAFAQVARIPGAVASPSIASCNNPAFTLLSTAPQPDACLKLGATVACGLTAAVRPAGTSASPTAKGGASPSPGAVATSPVATASQAAAGTTGLVVAPSPVPGAVGAVSPVPGAATDVAVAPPTEAAAEPVVVSLAQSREDRRQTVVLYWVAALAIAGAVVLPPVLVRRSRRVRPAADG